VSIKTLERAFATDIKIAKTELEFQVGTFIVTRSSGGRQRTSSREKMIESAPDWQSFTPRLAWAGK
jgi:hypothetical protein